LADRVCVRGLPGIGRIEILCSEGDKKWVSEVGIRSERQHSKSIHMGYLHAKKKKKSISRKGFSLFTPETMIRPYSEMYLFLSKAVLYESPH
jgi:hypothetical protein